MSPNISPNGWSLVRTGKPAQLVALTAEQWGLRLPATTDLPVPGELLPILHCLLAVQGAVGATGLRGAWLRSQERQAAATVREPDWERLQDVLLALELFECRSTTGQIVELVDRKRRYVEERDLSGWERSVADFFEHHVFGLEMPAQGAVIELGTARARNFQRLCAHFGPERCIGFDVVNYAQHPRIIEADVRALDAAQAGPVALGFNDLSDWAQSPASKRAGFDYLVPNIVAGGYYIDATLTDALRRALPLADFELVLDVGLFSVYRRS